MACLLYLQHTKVRAVVKEREGEGERERGNVKWKSAIAVIYQSGQRQQQLAGKWEFHRNVKLLLSEKSQNTTSQARLCRDFLLLASQEIEGNVGAFFVVVIFSDLEMHTLWHM